MRPTGLTDIEAFHWFMPGPPPSEGCWDWTGGVNGKGYGLIWMGKVPLRAHRLSYEIHHGPVGDQCVLHSCDRPICVQPAHLHLGTRTENMIEMVERGRACDGMRSGSAKLTDEVVLWIREQATMTHRAIAEALGVNQSTITRIYQRKTWKHL